MIKVITVNDRLNEKLIKGPSIFLAGPCPRDDSKDWRDDAIEYFRELGKDVNIFNPTNPYYDELGPDAYNIQCNWEWSHLSSANRILFWIPRDLEKNPAFTTNVEFGYWLGRDPYKVIYGRPNDAPKNGYLDELYKKECNKYDRKVCSTLKETVKQTLESL